MEWFCHGWDLGVILLHGRVDEIGLACYGNKMNTIISCVDDVIKNQL